MAFAPPSSLAFCSYKFLWLFQEDTVSTSVPFRQQCLACNGEEKPSSSKTLSEDHASNLIAKRRAQGSQEARHQG